MVKFNKNSILKNENKKKQYKKTKRSIKKITCLLKKAQVHEHEEEQCA
jgi:hypothetical protein